MMLSDERIAEMTVMVNQIEREVRKHFEGIQAGCERDAALVILRQSVALRKPLEKWNSLRACARTATQS